MRYHTLKLNLENLPWADYYSDSVLKVKMISKQRTVDDRYADDMNYGGYIGDDANAYYHARGTYEKLCSLKCQKQSEEVLAKAAELQVVFLADINNYLIACSVLLSDNTNRLKALVKMAGEVCCVKGFVELVKKHWEAEQEEKRENQRNQEYSIYADLLSDCLTKLQELYRTQKPDKTVRTYFRKITEPIIFLFKDANYQHEQELRIMYRYAQISDDFLHIDGEYPKLYLNPEIYLRIKEIILGPKMTEIPAKVPYLQEELEKLSQLLGVERPVISASEIEYQ